MIRPLRTSVSPSLTTADRWRRSGHGGRSSRRGVPGVQARPWSGPSESDPTSGIGMSLSRVTACGDIQRRLVVPALDHRRTPTDPLHRRRSESLQRRTSPASGSPCSLSSGRDDGKGGWWAGIDASRHLLLVEVQSCSLVTTSCDDLLWPMAISLVPVCEVQTGGEEWTGTYIPHHRTRTSVPSI